MPSHATSPATQAAPVGLPLAESDASSRSLSLATTHSSASRAGSWQQGPSNFPPPTSNPPMSVAIPGSIPVGHNLTAWRSHDSAASVQSATPINHPSQSQPQTPYTAANPSDRTQWPAPTQSYGYQEASRPQTFEAPQQPQHQYTQPAVQTYQGSPAPSQPHVYQQQPPAPPHAEFQGMQVSSPAGYQVPQQQQQQPQTFTQPAPYQMPQMQSAPPTSEYAGQQPGQMQPPPVPATAYHHPGPEGQQYATQSAHPPLQFRDDTGGRGYPINHYPSG